MLCSIVPNFRTHPLFLIQSCSAHRTPNFLFINFLRIFSSFKLISKYTQKCQYNSLYEKEKKPLCYTLYWGNWNSGFGKLGVLWAEKDINYEKFKNKIKKTGLPKTCFSQFWKTIKSRNWKNWQCLFVSIQGSLLENWQRVLMLWRLVLTWILLQRNKWIKGI